MYKNIEKQVKLNLKDQVEYQVGQVVSKTLVQNECVSMTIFSFDKGEEISTHAAGCFVLMLIDIYLYWKLRLNRAMLQACHANKKNLD